MINIEIDGKKLEAEPGSMVIAAADNAGIYIPRFCYHKKLSVAANCRMCLVEVEKSGKPLPACATPVVEGMKVFTQSKLALSAQKAVMEFLLINHPLDCPICDQGGACELQDLSMGFGSDGSRYEEEKRSVKDKDIGSLINTNMTRCIQCTRCVRFGREVAGLPELGATGRGENMEIGTYVEHSLVSEVSGNIIDLCPVGALLSKPFKFSARPWELDQYSSIAPHDCLGSHVHIHARRNVVMRIAPKDHEAINETWISDRDRFSYVGLQSTDRLTAPMIKRDGVWQETDWQTALNIAVHGLRDVIAAQGADNIGALTSPNSTLEEMYLLQKLWRGLGSENLDHRIRQTDVSDDQQPTLGIRLQDLEKQDAILLIGSNIRQDQPIAGLRVRKAALKGGKISCINMMDYDFNFPIENKLIVHPDDMVIRLAGIAKALGADIDVKPAAEEQAIAEQLKNAKNAVVLLGILAEQHPQASALRVLAQQIAELSGSTYGRLTEGANAPGAWIAGVVPGSSGLSAQAMLEKKLKAYLLLGIEPELDCANPAMAMQQALKNADFVVALSAFKSDSLMQHTDVILPIAPFSETSGTFVNIEGEWQSFAGAVPPLGEVRPAWKVLRVLGNLFELDGFEYQSSEEVRALIASAAKQSILKQSKWIAAAASAYAKASADKLQPRNDGHLMRIATWPMYRADGLTRRSQPLQDSAAAEKPVARMNTATAGKYNLSDDMQVNIVQGEGAAQLSVKIDSRIPDNCVYIPAGFKETAELGAAFGQIEMRALT